MKKISRRDFLRGSAGAALLIISGCDRLPLPQAARPTSSVGSIPTVVSQPAGFVPDVEINLKAVERQQQILSGTPTTVWTYEGDLIRGDATNLIPLAGSYLGPLIQVRKGQKVRIRFINELKQPSIIHWHGLLLPAEMDGHPKDVIQPGETYTYEFEVANRAGTYWYHPHPDRLTGEQVMRGLAGMFLVRDDEEGSAGLPSVAYDVPLVIQDRTFDANNQFVTIEGNSMPGMPGMPGMDMMMGFLGERILVNGIVNPLLPIATRAYRLRLLNGSNSRVYKLGWSNGAPMIVIATDGGLLERPVQKPYVMLGPGERVELWADFSQLTVGSEVELLSLPFLGAEGSSIIESQSSSSAPGMMPGMGHGMMQGGTPRVSGTPAAGSEDGMEDYNPKVPNGSAFSILKFRIQTQEPETLSLPQRLSTIQRYSIASAVNAAQPRRFGLSLRNFNWLINGRPFQLEEVAPDEIVKLGTLEAWDFVNELNPDEMMEQMGMVHPIHIHGVQFQVIARQAMVPELKAGWDSVFEGYVDEGWKDTVLVMPGEQVRLLMKFNYQGMFVFHCHNLEHEDLGMMRNYRADL